MDQKITDSPFTKTDPEVGSVVHFEKIRFLTFDESSTTNNIILRTNEYFSALEYRKGDAIYIAGSNIPF